MRRLLCSLVIVGCVSLGHGVATAQDRSGIGVGAEALLDGGPVGGMVVYDAGKLRASGMLGFSSNDEDLIMLGGRILFPLHESAQADFSLGGGAAVVDYDGPDVTDVHIEGLAQIRAFIVPNVALAASLGLAFVLRDNDRDDEFDLGGQVIGSTGIAYYFW